MLAERFRQRLLADEMLVAADVFDPLSAMLAADAGFEALYLGGYATAVHEGMAEPLLSMTEMRDRARAIAQATDVPLFVDADAGFGSADHTYRTVQEFARAGVAALFVEDQVVPKDVGYHAGRIELVSEARMREKVRAADRARSDLPADDVVLFARTDAYHKGRRASETLDDAIDRVNSYLDAGADAAILYPETREEAEYAVEHVDGPLKYSAGEYKDWTPSMATLEEIGFAFTNTSNSATAASTLALREFYEDFAETGELRTVDGEDMAAIRDHVGDVVGFTEDT